MGWIIMISWVGVLSSVVARNHLTIDRSQHEITEKAVEVRGRTWEMGLGSEVLVGEGRELSYDVHVDSFKQPSTRWERQVLGGDKATVRECGEWIRRVHLIHTSLLGFPAPQALGNAGTHVSGNHSVWFHWVCSVMQGNTWMGLKFKRTRAMWSETGGTGKPDSMEQGELRLTPSPLPCSPRTCIHGHFRTSSYFDFVLKSFWTSPSTKAF